MTRRDKLSFSVEYLSLVLIGIFICGCAAMKSPEGGPRDTTPPKVLKITPPNLSTNFASKKITIEFDEYIKLVNEFKEFSTSPELDRVPTLKTKLRKLEITLTDTLEANTTYTLNFGKSIVDLNEANELKNFSYVFSTGPTLDSLTISGNVKSVLTGIPELETTVFLLPLSRDSLFGKRKASIFTLTDSSGNFTLSNLKKDTYKIYALKEKSGDRIYQQENDEIGFLKDSIVLDQNITNIQLRVFKETAPNFRVLDRRLNADGSIFLRFNQQLANPGITILSPASLDNGKLYQFTKNKDSLTLWLNDLSFDSTKVVIKDNGKTLDTVKFSRGKRDTYTRIINATDNTNNGILSPFKDLTLTFNLPISEFDQSKVILLEDSIPRNFTIVKDSTNLLKYHIKYKWRPKEQYQLVMKENAISSIFSSKNKELKKTFTVGDVNDYGTLTLSVEVPDTTKNYILEIVDKEKNLVATYPIAKKSVIKLTNYIQGVYYGRVIYDTNKNGVWDSGNVRNGQQPEPIWYEPKELSIRANWDREEVIKIPLLPYPITLTPSVKTNESKPNGLSPKEDKIK